MTLSYPPRRSSDLSLDAAHRWWLEGGSTIDDRWEELSVEPGRISALPPARKEPGRIEVCIRGSTRGVRGDLSGPGSLLAMLVEVRLDRPTAGRELPQHRPIDPGDIGAADRKSVV